MKARLKNYRQSPRKVRLLANAVRGKSVTHAQTVLSVLPKKAALPLKKLIMSAASNAKQTTGIDEKKLMVDTIEVNKGHVFMRHKPRARGRATPIRKKTSIVTLTLKEETKAKKTKS